MIIELAIGAATMVVVSALARAVVQRRIVREAEAARRADELAKSADPRRGLRVGDVLLHVGDSLWLAGAIELDEEGTTFVLFRAPENERASWVAQLDDEGRELALLSESADVPDGSIPDRLPIGGRLLSLHKRGRARASVRGEHLPKTGPTARFTMLSDVGGKMAIVIDFEDAPRLTLLGDRVERALIDVLPGGDT